jgi:hypothetical protein
MGRAYSREERLNPKWMDKPCRVCGVVNRDRYGLCIPCSVRRNKIYRALNRDKAAERRRRYKENHKLETRARKEVRRALRMGKIVKSPFCLLCWTPTTKLDAHHPDHSKYLEVVWLCRLCHLFIHGKGWRKGLGNEAENYSYRTEEGFDGYLNTLIDKLSGRTFKPEQAEKIIARVTEIVMNSVLVVK